MSVLAFSVAVFLLAVLLNGLFAGYETGFVSADRIRIRYLSEEEKNARAKRLLEHMGRPERMITTVLVGTNIALIVGTMAITQRIEQGWLATLIVTPAFLIFAEIIPKSVFRSHPNRLSLALLPLIRLFDLLLAPIVLPAMVATRLLRWVTGTQEEEMNTVLSSEEDFRHLVDESAARGSIEREEQEMIHSVMDLQTTPAKEIMVPRIDIQALPRTASRTELAALFEQSGRTRIPIYNDTIDEIGGLTNAYDLLLDENPGDDSIDRFVKDVMHVPDTMPVDDLLEEFKESGQRMAVVTDEYGGTDGLITLEDILEEIFGEIHDEHDRAQEMIRRVGGGAFVIDARMSLEDMAEVVEIQIQDEQVETVGGWVMHVAGRIPFQGEKIKHDGFRITVLAGTSSSVTKIRLDILPGARGQQETTPGNEGQPL